VQIVVEAVAEATLVRLEMRRFGMTAFEAPEIRDLDSVSEAQLLRQKHHRKMPKPGGAGL